MKRIVRPFVILFSSMLLMASCLGDDTGYDDLVYYSDTAIASFSLGTLNRTMWTKSSEGEDSSYVADLDASGYKFYIDQLKREIYNPDSLPVGTDVAHVICNVSGKNGGTVIVVHKDVEGEDSLAYFVSTDSIDFTEPREFRVYANDGSAYRSYKVSVNVHKENPDSFNWHKAPVFREFESLSYMRAVALDGRLLVFGEQGGATSVYSASLPECNDWAKLDADMQLDAGAARNAIVRGGVVYTLSGGNLVSSADGASWAVAGTAPAGRLLGAGRVRMYGTDGSGRIVSSADGVAWAAESMVGGGDMLPSDDVSLACMPFDTDGDAENIIVAGNRGIAAYPEDSVAMVWNKLEEYSAGSQAHSWMFCGEDNGCRLPRLSGLVMAAYDDVLVALGGRGIGGSTAEAFSQVYVSWDNGLTWHADGSYYLPEGFTNGGSGTFAAAVDADDYLWVVCGGTGDVWRGRLNRLGWDEGRTSFTE